MNRGLGVMLLLALAAGSVEAEADAGDEVVAEVTRLCNDRWPTDFKMQEHCRFQQSDGLDGLKNWFDAIPSNGGTAGFLATALLECKDRWWRSDVQAEDYYMWNHCVTEQYKAAKRLGY